MDESIELLSVLSDSPHRLRILQRLTEGKASVDALGPQLDIPRSTIKHNLQRLANVGLVEQTATGYEVSTFGSTAVEIVTSCTSLLEISKLIQPFLEASGDNESNPDIALFREANVTLVTSVDPHAPIEQFLEIACKKEYGRIVTPIVVPRIIDVLHAEMVDRNMNIDLIVPPNIQEKLRTEYKTEFEESIESGQLTVGVYDEEIPFGLSLFGESVTLSGFDEDNLFRCLVECRGESAVRWGESVYREYEKEIDEFVTTVDERSQSHV